MEKIVKKVVADTDTRGQLSTHLKAARLNIPDEILREITAPVEGPSELISEQTALLYLRRSVEFILDRPVKVFNVQNVRVTPADLKAATNLPQTCDASLQSYINEEGSKNTELTFSYNHDE